MELVGKQLAHYEITAPLGKGGMGEVYRATDVNLGREVAIKVLPPEFTSDSERLQRFEREARVLAALEHTHIASIYGIETVDDVRFLVMQLADGEDLSNRLRRGPIPLDEALEIAKQIAAALEVAHDKGIVHRDLKPANVMIDPDGDAKVLDFGLAKAFETDEEDESFSNSPTMVRAATHAGVILGTAAYMSPEQARGKRVDKRADIWAFGVLLLEMLTGERLFEGETVSDTLAAVLTREIDLGELPGDTPRSVRWVLERCLERDPKRRLRDIGEARIALENGGAEEAGAAEPSPEPPSSSRREIAAWSLSALLLVLLLLTAAKLLRPEAAPSSEMISRLRLFDDAALTTDGGSSVILSADGRTIVVVAEDGEGTQLYVKRMDQLDVTPIPGTRGARGPFFSPDGKWIGFFADRKLKKVAVSGGAPLTMCDAPLPRGGSWGEGGTIVFSAGVATGLSVISENGGSPQTLTTPNDEARERSHRWPHFLPGGKAVVFMAQSRGRNYEDATIQLVEVGGPAPMVLHEGGAYPRYASSGHLLFARQGTLFALPFDLENLTAVGTPKPVLQQVLSKTGNEATDDGTAHFDVSRGGVLVYRQGLSGSSMNRMVLVDRENRRLAESPPGSYTSPVLSPDGTAVAVGLSTDTRADIWVWDPRSGNMNRLTFDGVYNAIPVWSPDGREIAYSSTRTADSGVEVAPYVRAADGSAAERPLAPAEKGLFGASGWLTSWPVPGELVYQSDARTRGPFELYLLPIDGEPPTEPLFPGLNGILSPDGKWMLYQSNESIERDEIFVRRTDGGGGRYQVSSSGGMFPHWTRGGREIVWSGATDGYLAAPVEVEGGRLVIGEPERLAPSDGIYQTQNPLPAWDVSEDGSTFVFLESTDADNFDVRSVILDSEWFDDLERLAPRE